MLFLGWPQFDAAEVEFWRGLSEGLVAHGLRLVLTSTAPPPRDLHIDYVPAVPSIDTWWPQLTEERIASLDAIGLDADELLAREADWGAPSILPAVVQYRRRAMEAVAGHWLHTLAVLNPAAVVIWNGQHVSERILDAAARQGGAPVLYVERAPVPGALFADERGLSAASAVAHRRAWPIPDSAWHGRAVAVSRRMAAGGCTWWAQPAARGATGPELRRHLGIPETHQVVLFAGQVDADTQRFQFSPHFRDNLSAFAWLLRHLHGRDRVFVLGKHHPRSATDPAAYRRLIEASGVAGDWRADLAIDDALAIADRVAAVNSTVLYEALARGIPALALGDWLLGGRGVAHDLRDPRDGPSVVAAWLAAADAGPRARAWMDGLAFLLSHSIYGYRSGPDGLLGPADLAARITALTRPGGSWRLPAAVLDQWLAARARVRPPWRLPDEACHADLDSGWQQAHQLRHQLMAAAAAVERGRRLVIWGTGAAGRMTAAALEGAGVPYAAFVTSTAAGGHLDGRPVLAPSDLSPSPPRDFVLVAARAAVEILPVLLAGGFVPGDDLQVIDCDVLAALAATVTPGPRPPG